MNGCAVPAETAPYRKGSGPYPSKYPSGLWKVKTMSDKQGRLKCPEFRRFSSFSG
jgi:hypothetical protein